MRAIAYLTAFHIPKRDGPNVQVRPIEIPDDKARDCKTFLEAAGQAYHYGQNDVQPSIGHYSVSVGDVIEVDGARARFRVAPVGFIRMDPKEDPTALVGLDARDAAETGAAS